MHIARKKVIVAMSGGVDSTVAALLMKLSGKDSDGQSVKGVFMHNWDEVDETGYCASEQDYATVQDICKRLNIPCSRVTFVKEYWNDVFSEMLTGYQEGRTPNPDVLCNERIKFGVFLKHAITSEAADQIVTGHYARIRYDNAVWKLLKSNDKHKDQTYFLATISQDALKKVIFPVGDLQKAVVKQIARDAGFADVAASKESMGLCFVGQRKFSHFIKQYVNCKPGNFVTLDGIVIGKHSGQACYTIGQKTGLSMGSAAYYVAKKTCHNNEITVYLLLLAVYTTPQKSPQFFHSQVPGAHHKALYCQTFYTGQPHWISGKKPVTLEKRYTLKHRRGPLSSWCVLKKWMGGGLKVEAVDTPFRAVTPGQYAVFYDNEECLGAALITNSGPSLIDLQ